MSGVGSGWILNGPPTMRALRRTIKRCRASCSYCSVVQRLTKILGFFYCGYGTVINLSGEDHLENGGVGGDLQKPEI